MDRLPTYRESRDELTRILSEEERNIEVGLYIKKGELNRHILMTREDLSLVMQASSLETYDKANQNTMKQIKERFLIQVIKNEKNKSKKQQKEQVKKELKVEITEKVIIEHPLLDDRKSLEDERNKASMSGSNTGEKRKEVYENTQDFITKTLSKSAQKRLDAYLTSQSTFAVGIQSHNFFQKVEKELQEHLQKTHKDL